VKDFSSYFLIRRDNFDILPESQVFIDISTCDYLRKRIKLGLATENLEEIVLIEKIQNFFIFKLYNSSISVSEIKSNKKKHLRLLLPRW
jgi:hypothetical protein